jgi:PST family polysaccharide transporter
MVDRVGIYFEDHRESHDLARRALRGGIISVAIKYGNGLLQIAAAIILARLLVPEDFGLVAIIAVVTGFAPMLIDFGLGDAITLRSRINRSQVSTLFWISSALGLTVCLCVVALSPLIAWLYGDPRLELIAMSTAVTFLFSGLSIQHLALLKRNMQFAQIGKIQFLATFVGIAIAVATAKGGFGYWALVFRPISTAFCVMVGAWFACRWRPGALMFDSEVRSIIRFGLHVVSFTVASMVTRVVDRMALGLVYHPDQVGYYQNAMNLYDNSIAATLEQSHNVGSTALAKLRTNPAALRERYEAALSMLSFFLMPASAILSVVAGDLTVILLGAKWHATGTLLSILALRGIVQPIEASQGWLHLSVGRADRWRNWGIVALVVQVAVVLCGLPFGAAGVATAVVAACALLSVPSIVYAGRPIGVDTSVVLRATGRQMIGATAALAVGWWFQTTFLDNYSSYGRIVVSGVLCSCIYLALVVGLFRLTEPIRVGGRILMDLKGRL